MKRGLYSRSRHGAESPSMSVKCQQLTLRRASNSICREQGQQGDTAYDGKNCAVNKHSRTADMVPEQSGDDARH